MSSFASNQQNPQKELSPEALARKLEKIRMNRIKLKEKKRLKNLADKGELSPAALSVSAINDRHSSGVRVNSEGSTSSSMVKNLLGIAPLAAEGSHIFGHLTVDYDLILLSRSNFEE